MSGFIDNSRSDLPCGTDDPDALLPTPVHYDCGECAAYIKRILLRRLPPPSVVVEAVQQPLFDDLSPVRR